MGVIHLSSKYLDETIIKGVTMVDFWATWCESCRKIGKTMEELGGELERIATVAKVDVDNEHDLAVRFGVSTIPTIIIFKDGEEKERIIGVHPKKTYINAVNKY